MTEVRGGTTTEASGETTGTVGTAGVIVLSARIAPMIGGGRRETEMIVEEMTGVEAMRGGTSGVEGKRSRGGRHPGRPPETTAPGRTTDPLADLPATGSPKMSREDRPSLTNDVSTCAVCSLL